MSRTQARCDHGWHTRSKQWGFGFLVVHITWVFTPGIDVLVRTTLNLYNQFTTNLLPISGVTTNQFLFCGLNMFKSPCVHHIFDDFLHLCMFLHMGVSMIDQWIQRYPIFRQTRIFFRVIFIVSLVLQFLPAALPGSRPHFKPWTLRSNASP